MNSHQLFPAAPRHSRRRALQRSSFAAAAIWLGASQCEAPAPTPPAAASPAADAPIVPGPDGTAISGRCTQYEHLFELHAPAGGWDVERMSRLAWRESNCWPEVRSRTSDTGLVQINDVSLGFLTTELGEPVDRWTLTDPTQNVRAAAALCAYWAAAGSSCYQPWSAT